MAHIRPQPLQTGSQVAQVTVRPNGVTASFPRFGPLAEVAPRGKVKGWSTQSTGRLRRWFYGVDGDQLDGVGLGVSLTVRDLPPTAADWTVTHRNFLKRMRRAGLVRGQWLTEWQKRGVPHLHGALYFPEGSTGLQELVTGHWLAAAGEWGAGESGQHVAVIWGLPGWLQYQAKHSSRGVRHYQRANVPAAWREGTGRLWGTVGKWPVREEVVSVSTGDFHRFRRLLRRWLVSEARKDLSAAQGPRPSWEDFNPGRERAALRRLLFLEGMLRCPDPKLSAVRAVGEFCPEVVSRELLLAATWGVLPEALDAEEASTDRAVAPPRA